MYFPDSIYLAAVDIPYKKLEQAESKSNAKASVAPISEATKAAVDAACISCVAVATMTNSISFGTSFDFLIKSSVALIAKKEVPLPGSFKILRSLIPVRETIHSSFVSTIVSNISLVNTWSGTYFPTAVIAAVILII